MQKVNFDLKYSLLSVGFMFGNLTIFLFIYNLIIKKAIEFYKSLTKVEKWLMLASFISIGLLILISDCFTGMFVGKPNNENFTWYEILSFDTCYSYGLNNMFDPYGTVNDIRHMTLGYPFVPFLIIPYMILNTIKLKIVFTIYVQFLQLLLVSITIILLSRIVCKDSKAQIACYLLAFLSACVVFNILVYEKFVVGYFFAILAIYATIKEENTKYLYFVLASLALSIFVVLFPFVFFYKKKSFKDVICQMATWAMVGLAILFLTGRIYHLLHFKSELYNLRGFTDEKNGKQDTFYMYFSLLTNFFVLPDWCVSGQNIWFAPLERNSVFFFIGIAIFVIAVLGFILNFKDTGYRVLFYWFLMVAFFCVYVGWGAAQNEMFIYSITYFFGIIPLVFGFLDRIIKNRNALIVVVSVLVTAMCVYNLIVLIKMIGAANGLLPMF